MLLLAILILANFIKSLILVLDSLVLAIFFLIQNLNSTILVPKSDFEAKRKRQANQLSTFSFCRGILGIMEHVANSLKDLLAGTAQRIRFTSTRN